MYHNEVVEQFLVEVLGNLVQVVGDKVMVAVNRDTGRQLQGVEKINNHTGTLKALCHTRAIFVNYISVTRDVTTPTRLKSHTEFSINGHLMDVVMSCMTLIY